MSDDIPRCSDCLLSRERCDCPRCRYCGRLEDRCKCDVPLEPLDFDDNSDDLTDKEDRDWE